MWTPFLGTRVVLSVCLVLVACGDDDPITPISGVGPVDSVQVLPPAATLVIGDTARLVAQAFDSAGTSVSAAPFTWTSGNTTAASVSTTGLVTALAAGTSVITATSNGFSGSSTITVTQELDSVEVTPTNATIFVGDTVRIRGTGFDVNGDSIASLVFTWTSSNEAAATVDALGLVTGQAFGTTMITGTAGGLSAQATVVVDTMEATDFNEPAGFTAIVERPFNSKAADNNDRGTGEFPNKEGGSEGWDGFEFGETNLTIVAGSDPLSPGSAMRFNYPVGLAANNGPGVAQTLGLGSPTNLYVRTALRLGPDYYVGSVSNKLYFHRMSGSPRGEPFLALHPNGDGTFRLAANFQGTPDNGLGFFFASAPANALERETWYVIETVLIMNSAEGVADGIFRVYLDGELVLERTDVSYITTSGARSWDTLHVSPTYGGDGVPNAALFYFDLGHAYVSGGD